MKFNKERDKDCYLYISNGEIMEEDKIDTDIKTMSQESNIKPREKDLYDKLSEFTDKLPKKKVFNRILIGIISLICISLFFSIAKIIKYTFISNDLINNPQKIEEVYLIADTIQNSNKYLLEYFNTVNNLIRNNRTDLNSQVLSMKDTAIKDLNDIKSLNSYITSKELKESISILEYRFKNFIDMCTSISTNFNSNNVTVYNSYTKTEIEQLELQITKIKEVFDNFNIKYSVNSNNYISYNRS